MSFDNFQAIYQCYSPAFLTDHEQTKLENGGKILLPQSALEQLAEHVNIKFECFLSLSNKFLFRTCLDTYYVI